MKRKLVQQGSSTMMISLPSKWVKQNNLGKGSEIDLDEKGNGLLVSPEEIKTKKQTSIKLSDLTESLIRTLITNTYRKGYEKITVDYSDEKQFKILESIVKNKLLGFEIIKKKEKSCVVENITEPSAEQFDNLLEKEFLNIEELLEITKKRLSGDRVDEHYEEVEERIQKYDNFCKRVIMKNMIEEKSVFLWTFLTLITHGQREIYHLNKIIKEKQKKSKKLISLIEGSEKMFSLIKNAYNKKDLAIITEIHKLEKTLIYKDGYEAIKGDDDNRLIYHLLLSIREFYQANSSLSAIIL